MQYDNMLALAEEKKLEIIEIDLHGKLKGLYSDDTIAISTAIESIAEKTCILAEEIGHHVTTIGCILDQKNLINTKKERAARGYAYNKMVGIGGIVRAFEHGCKNRYEAADCLGITEEFFDAALKYYHQKYGQFSMYNDYIIYFEPLIVVKKI